MAMILNKKEETDELSRRISADLKAKQEESSRILERGANPDFAEDSEYVKDFQKTSRFGFLWALLLVLVVVVGIVVAFNL